MNYYLSIPKTISAKNLLEKLAVVFPVVQRIPNTIERDNWSTFRFSMHRQYQQDV